MVGPTRGALFANVTPMLPAPAPPDDPPAPPEVAAIDAAPSPAPASDAAPAVTPTPEGAPQTPEPTPPVQTPTRFPLVVIEKPKESCATCIAQLDDEPDYPVYERYRTPWWSYLIQGATTLAFGALCYAGETSQARQVCALGGGIVGLWSTALTARILPIGVALALGVGGGSVGGWIAGSVGGWAAALLGSVSGLLFGSAAATAAEDMTSRD